MKYLTETKKLLRKICDNNYGYKVSDDEWEEMEMEIVKSYPGIYTKLMTDIEIGISNGYSLEQQINIVEETIFKYYV